MDLRAHLRVIRSWLPLLIASVVLASGAAYLVSTFQPKVYEARATLIVGQALTSANPNYTDLLASQQVSETYAEVATQPSQLAKVIRDLNLPDSPDQLLARVDAEAPDDLTLLRITARDENPEIAARIANELAQELIALSPTLQGGENSFQDFLVEDLAAIREDITATTADLDRLIAIEARTPAQEEELDVLRGRLTDLRSAYATMLSYMSTNAPNLLSVSQEASAPASPVSPRPVFNAIIAAVVGLLIAIGVIVAAQYLDDSLKNPEDVQEVLELPTLGTIARMKGERGRAEMYRLATLLYPRSRAAESYRSLRANIEFSSLDEPIRTLLVTSAVPTEGKSVTASNLAVAFAQAGRRVLLVDADLRRPSVHTIFGAPNQAGLTTLLRSDGVTAEAVAVPTEEPRLSVLTSGPLPPNPAELLGSQRFRTVLDRLKAQYDLVVVDSPPLKAVADPAVLGSFLDGTLLVVAANATHRAVARAGREALVKAGARVLGVVLNRLAEPDAAEYGDYYGARTDGEEPARGRDRSPRTSAP
jgi:succinoglycan biosynthesis transport protein ExoP